MRPIVFLTLGFAPIIALGMYLYFTNRHGKSFGMLLLKAFLAGAFGIVVLLAAELLSTILGLNELRNLKRVLFFSFITIAGGSELGKFIFYRYFIIPKNEVNKPLHGITFSIMTALGFSTVALVFFILNPFGTSAAFPATLYAFIFVPANILFSVIMGFFVGMSKFLKTRVVYSLTGLVGAAFFHGIFNFCMITQDFKLLSLFSFGSTVIVFILGMKAAFTEPEQS